jgi:cytoskeletal protein RodZ
VDDDQPTRPQPRDPRLDDETTRFPRPEPDQTSILPPAEDPGRAQPPPERWSARAGVPTGPRRTPMPQEPEWVPDRQQPRTWWAPILIVVAILVLLGLVGLGLWLATHGQPATTPSASASASPSASSPSPSPTPSRSPSRSPSPSVAAVGVPAVGGVMVTDAEEILKSQGLKWKVVTQVSDQAAGSVVRTDPAAGVQVPAGSTVTLYVATPPPTSASPSPSPSGTP